MFVFVPQVYVEKLVWEVGWRVWDGRLGGWCELEEEVQNRKRAKRRKERAKGRSEDGEYCLNAEGTLDMGCA